MPDIRERFTDREWEIKESGKCSYQVSYGVVTPTSDVGNVGYCREPSWPGDDLGYCRDHAFPDMADTVEMITGCCPATVFYDADGRALILASDGTWIARVDLDGQADTAYLSAEPIETLVSVREDTFTVGDLPELQGFRPGWEC